ncbi:hypothetical protein [Haloferax sp. DFSO60]|uniref:hypothetical protein n=1 Tax=Haloferax sp. DFSO60 TaxID=3388652 RepID=UPI0039797248
MSGDKECFVICPIGDEGSETRDDADKLMEYIINKAVEEFGYTTNRADEMPEPGNITTQIIEKVIESELVIADLTDHNPNVFYELALRHATGKPFIQLIDSSQSIPFDISEVRTIHYDFDVRDADRASEKIKAQIEAIEQDDSEIENPISRAADMKSWRESDDPVEKSLVEILERIGSLNNRVEGVEKEIKQSSTKSRHSKTKVPTFSESTTLYDVDRDEFIVPQQSIDEVFDSIESDSENNE